MSGEQPEATGIKICQKDVPPIAKSYVADHFCLLHAFGCHINTCTTLPSSPLPSSPLPSSPSPPLPQSVLLHQLACVNGELTTMRHKLTSLTRHPPSRRGLTIWKFRMGGYFKDKDKKVHWSLHRCLIVTCAVETPLKDTFRIKDKILEHRNVSSNTFISL